jgi:murein DD-endopeptidase MepM/ murein hydrolase activator NlpD
MAPSSHRARATLAVLLAAAAAVAGLAGAPHSRAQSNPIGDLFTTTTVAPPPTTTTTVAAPTEGDELTEGAGQAPAGAADAAGDGAAAPEGGIVVPPDAQRIINAVRRTGSNDNDRLLTAVGELVAMGMTEQEAYRVGLGRFPIAGAARYSHDWLYPRYGPGFRFHLGCDVFAAHGTPVRAPVDGTVTTSNDSLGGLSVKVHMADKTYFYLAHLSGLVEGFVDGMAVRTGDIVGYVGDSGNARGGSPHVHVGVYPRGGAPVDPKPILDQFLVEAEAHLPEVIAAYRSAGPQVAPEVDSKAAAVAAEQRLLRPMLATEAVRAYASGGDAWSPAALYLLAADPTAGAGHLLRNALDDLANGIDWSASQPEVARRTEQ